jgi:hypothetical protein
VGGAKGRVPYIVVAFSVISQMTASNADSAPRPEEEELFREFQSYVRSIYVAASDGAMQNLQAGTNELRREVERLEQTVREGRENYVTLFDPAVAKFSAAVSTALEDLARSHEVLARDLDARAQSAIAQAHDQSRAIVVAEGARQREELLKIEGQRIRTRRLLIAGLVIVALLQIASIALTVARP